MCAKCPKNGIYCTETLSDTPTANAAFFSSLVNQNTAAGRDVFVIGQGIWSDGENDDTIGWFEQFEDAMNEGLSTYHEAQAFLFPRLSIMPSAHHQGRLSQDGHQNDMRLQHHVEKVSSYATARGHEYLSFYNLSLLATSPDGIHSSYEDTLMKAMMVLNWLNMLHPSNASPRRPPVPSALDETRPSSPIVDTTTLSTADVPASTVASGPHKQAVAHTSHPVDDLITNADTLHAALVKKQSSTVEEAATAYRERRGRHPPPTFDKWFHWSRARGALIIEDYFDQIYNDIEPFWGVPPWEMREFPKSWGFVLSIRNGTIKRWTDEPFNIAPWMNIWEQGFHALPLQDIPDVDLAFNGEDEPKLFVPWETIRDAKARGDTSKHTNKPTTDHPAHNDFHTLPPMNMIRPLPHDRTGFKWAEIAADAAIWVAAREACPPTSAARSAPVEEDYSTPAVFTNASAVDWMHHGYVSNWTAAKSACINPHFRNIHGSFIAALSWQSDNPTSDRKAVVTQLVPLLSGCKIHDVNAEILIPPAMQWPDHTDSAGESFSFEERNRLAWDDKLARVVWRGSASGGINKATTWTRFQRHRFVAMLNGSLAARHLAVAHRQPPAHVPGGQPLLPHNFPLPDPAVYPLAALAAGGSAGARALGVWLSSVADVAFVHLRCFPPMSWFGSSDGGGCAYSGPWFAVRPIVPGVEAFKYKYQPDLDGASYSGRYRAILHSNSLPMKSTIYDEWHDSRIVPWKHFVPMDVGNVDLWGLIEYFLGYGEVVAGHDEAAKRIALDGAAWARTVLRDEDMLVYVYRLILELARLMDDRREQMGWVGDL